MMLRVLVASALACVAVQAYAPTASAPRLAARGLVRMEATSRRDVLATSFAAGAMAAFAGVAPASAKETESGIVYKVVKEGRGGSPKLGDLIAIKFKATFKGVVFDDILDAPEPYYYRVGSNQLIPAIDECVPMMKVGEVWEMTVPGKMAFGAKGKPPTPGKPRIPADAPIDYVLELVAVPGKEEDLIEIIGDV